MVDSDVQQLRFTHMELGEVTGRKQWRDLEAEFVHYIAGDDVNGDNISRRHLVVGTEYMKTIHPF